MSTPTIQLSNVSKRFGDLTALDDVSLDIQPGGVFAILGENGAGKTTAIRILLGLELPDTGRASVLGMDSSIQGREIRRQIGYVPEQPALYPWMTVGEIGWFSEGY
jgi:ABC-2 type transport system ATP-binding protein